MFLDEHEEVVLKHAGREAGSYLEQIGKFNLAELTPEEFNCFMWKAISFAFRNWPYMPDRGQHKA